jgi:hypothetical protein
MANNEQKINAWQKAKLHPSYPGGNVRIDEYGSAMVWSEYGMLTQNGWEIDHELPLSSFPAFATLTENQRALHWRNNRRKSDKIDLASFLR